jgi:hypothetical protein
VIKEMFGFILPASSLPSFSASPHQFSAMVEWMIQSLPASSLAVSLVIFRVTMFGWGQQIDIKLLILYVCQNVFQTPAVSDTAATAAD